MPRSKKTFQTAPVDFRYVILTYGLGLYGGLVSGILFSWATQAPSAIMLWVIGIALVFIGLLLFVIIHKRLDRNR